MLDGESDPPLLPAAALGEIGYVAARRHGRRAVDAFLGDLDSGALVLDSGEDDASRVRALLTRYADLGLDLVDAFVIVCAERNGGRVLTLDRRHRDVVGRELELEVLPG